MTGVHGDIHCFPDIFSSKIGSVTLKEVTILTNIYPADYVIKMRLSKWDLPICRTATYQE